MTKPPDALTATDLIAAASSALAEGGYHQVTRRFEDWDTPTSRLFEDEYNIVGLVVFDTCGDLLRSWPDLQGSLVDVISRNVGREESKAWDGYLALFSLGFASSESAALDAVRYNTARLRKLVATADDVHNPSDVERVLRALLPLSEEGTIVGQQSALDLLPRLLADHDIAPETTQILVDAFREHSPLLERLHRRTRTE